MSIRDILTFVFKHLRRSLWILAAVVTLTTASVYLFPQSYTATATVLIEAAKSPTLRTENQYGLETALVLYTEIEIVRSRAVMESVVDELHLDEPPNPRNPIAKAVAAIRNGLTDVGLLDPVPQREKMILILMKDVDVEPVLDTNIFTISYADENASRAADIVNAVSQAYISHKRTIYSSEGALGYLKSNVDNAKRDLDALQDRLDDFRASQPEIAALESQRESLVMEVGRLENTLNNLRLQLSETLSRFAPTHRKSTVLTDKIDIVETQIQSTKQRIRTLEAAKNEVDTIEALITSQQKTYEAFKGHYDSALPSALADQALTNSRIVDTAEVPAKPRFPRLIFVLVSIFAGGLLAVLLAFIREYFDSNIETEEQVEAILGVPVIGSVFVDESMV